ncbi:MAG: hypothetical protein HKN12_09185 [Gemmatimonadetes bacterium]|nr:hypothetical protein [Gemmatimonadota bacterium]
MTMRAGPAFPRGEWATTPLRLFHQDRVQVQTADGDWVAGTLEVVGSGLEIAYDEPRAIAGCVESSRFVTREDAGALRLILRPETLWTDAVRARREDQIWFAAHPSWPQRFRRWTRELVRRDPVATEPLLRRYVGRRVLVEAKQGERSLLASGLLLTFDREFIALADATLPAETQLPLCPGKTTGANLEIVWNDEGLELFNRGPAVVTVLGLRTAQGLQPWEIALRPGFREQTSFRRAPAGTAELVFESPVKGDAILPRKRIRVRGGSEGSVGIPGLPDLATLADLPDGPPPEEEEAGLAVVTRLPNS